MRLSRATLLALAVLLALSACSKKPTQPAAPDRSDRISAQLNARLDSLVGVPQTTRSVVLPNGLSVEAYLALVRAHGPADATGTAQLGPQDARNYLVALLAEEALALSDRSLWIKADEGADKPAQPNGLAYVFGGKNPGVRSKSATGCCPQLYGLDCSGFLAALFAHASVTIPQGPADDQRDAAKLTTAIKANPEFAKVRVDDLGAVDPAKLESGDILYWTDASGVARHIGIVLGGQIYQSNGSDGGGSGNCDATQCTKNASTSRGPRPIPLSQAMTFFRASGYTYGGAVRIQAELSGRWTFSMRCIDATFDVLTTDLTFPTTTNTSWVIDKDFTDYNGGALSGHFQFSYDRVTNVLSGRFAISSPDCPVNPFRTEEFSVKLSRDDTNYFATDQVAANECSGCPVAIRLLNNETGAAKPASATRAFAADSHSPFSIGPAVRGQ